MGNQSIYLPGVCGNIPHGASYIPGYVEGYSIMLHGVNLLPLSSVAATKPSPLYDHPPLFSQEGTASVPGSGKRLDHREAV